MANKHGSLKELFTAIADAIRAKTGSTEEIVADDFPDVIGGIVSNDTTVEDAIINRTIVSYSNDRVKKLDFYAFAECDMLKNVYFPNVEDVGNYTFYGCDGLTTVDFPKAKEIGMFAFAECTTLSNIKFPVVAEVHRGAFSGTRGIGEFAYDSLYFVGHNAFENSTLRLLDGFVKPSTQYNHGYDIGSNAFAYSNLTICVLRRDTELVELSDANAFDGTPIADGTGYIYVPRALIEQYKVAENWSTFASQFRALEDYTVDGTITGELKSNL